jgi:hypothetical protein
MAAFWRLLGAGIAGALSLTVLVACLLIVGTLTPQPTCAESSPLIYRLDAAMATTEGSQITITPNAESLCFPNGTCVSKAQWQAAFHLPADEPPVDVCTLLGECR